MKLIQNKIYRSVLIILWLLIFSNAFATYKDMKDLDIPATILDFDISLVDIRGEGERGVFYYDTGKGFNKDEVKVFNYSQALGETKHYKVPLATNKKILKLRFDPLDGEGALVIENLTVLKYNSRKVSFVKKEIDANAKNAIGALTITNDSIKVETIGNDPNFILVDNFDEYQKK